MHIFARSIPLLPWVPEATRLLNPAGLVWPAGFSKRVPSGTHGIPLWGLKGSLIQQKHCI